MDLCVATRIYKHIFYKLLKCQSRDFLRHLLSFMFSQSVDCLFVFFTVNENENEEIINGANELSFYINKSLFP